MPSEVFTHVLSGFIVFVITLFLQPLLEDKVQFFLIKIGSRIPWLRPKQSLAGNWFSIMVKDGIDLNRNDEISNIQINEVKNRIAGTFEWKGRTYRLLARKSNQYLTGTYEDIAGGFTFQGAFQLRILPDENAMKGRWIGFNYANEIIEGPWQWRRENYKYPFEI